MFDWLWGKGAKPTYEQAKKVAAEGDPGARQKLASMSDLEPELLYYFALDDDDGVRREIAGNAGAPLQAKVLLSRDKSDQVRQNLAQRVQQILPELSDDESSKAGQMVLEVLENLANDQTPKVRAMLAEEIKSLDNVPKGTVGRLARDEVEEVASPILEHSPLIDDNDLMEIISSRPHDDRLTAIARRAGLGDSVASAVARTEHPSAVKALLENATSELSDDTLTFISERAETHVPWHLPLVGRPSLPLDAIKKVCSYVATDLVNTLIDKHSLPEDLKVDLRQAAFQRLNPDQDGNHDHLMTRVVVAEPRKQVRRIIENALTDLGFADLRCVSDGEEALRLFSAAHTPTGLVICATSMDELDGLDVLEQVRELDDEVPFILVGNLGDESYEERADILKVTGLLKPPVTFDKVAEMVGDIFGIGDGAGDEDRELTPTGKPRTEAPKLATGRPL